MAKGSQLAQLKAALSETGTSHQQRTSKKRKRSGVNPQQSDRDKKAAKLREIHERLNPFDTKVTKLKHDVGGRKLKGVTGKPALSKQAGIDQRTKVLLKEHEQRHHVGGIVDRRFGENDPTMTPEERMLERFTKERQRATQRSTFNLEEEGDLTHYGQSLSKMDDFDTVGLGLEDEEEDQGHLDERTVRKAHFGGFGDEEEDEEDEDGQPERKKSKAEVMAEVIAKSKEHKALRQLSRQQDEDLRHQLDNELDSIRDLLFSADPSTLIPIEASTLSTSLPQVRPAIQVSQTDPNHSELPSAPTTLEDRDAAFDHYVRELAFDKRARPKDRTKTEEELAIEEKERLEKSERRRLRRMEGGDDYDSEEEAENARQRRKQARGGDDLEDDFNEDPGILGVGLDDGEGIGMEETAINDNESSEEGDDDSEDGNDGPSSGGDTSQDHTDPDEDLGEEGEHLDLIPTKKSRATTSGVTPSKRKELPFTFPCPETHEDFLEILEDVEDADIPIVVQRIRALHHPSLAVENKSKLQAFSGVLIDHILFAASPPTPRLELVSALLPHLAGLTQKYPTESASHFISKVTLMEKNLRRGLSLGALEADAKTLPRLPELVLLRVIGTLWPTSDMNHSVVSPARLLMGAYLGLSRVRSLQDIASGLFLCTLWLQYEQLSKRFVPEALNFAVNAVLHLAPHGMTDPSDVPGSFPCPDLDSEQCRSLSINAKRARKVSLASRKPDLVAILENNDQGEEVKVDLLMAALDILSRFSEMYKSLDAFAELYEPILAILQRVRAEKLPQPLQARLVTLRDTLGRLLKFFLQARQPLLLQAHKPIPIPSYIPKFEMSGSSYIKNRDPDQERAEASKLKRQYKQEKKGAMRELRKDARFLAGVQQREQADRDRGYEDRMRKVFGTIEGERAEEKKLEKEKAKIRKRAGKK